MIPWQSVPCATCGKPAAGVLAGPSGFCDESRTVLCRAHYILERMRRRKAKP